MRIFMLVQHPGARGPVPKHTSHLVGALRSLDCVVVTHPWGQHGPGESLLKKVSQRIRDVISVRRVLQDDVFDIAVVKTAHDWNTLIRDIAVVLVIRRRCRPVVLQLHGSRAWTLVEPGSRAFKLATRALLLLVDGLIVLSTQEQAQWQAFDPAVHVLTAKNPYVRKLSGAPDAIDAPASGARALFVGRLIEEKGIFDLIEAFAKVLETTDCHLVMVGDGADERALRERIRTLGVENRVSLPGHLTGPQLRHEYRAATVFVFPSWSEGFPTVLAEAMDAALPIVTTRIHGAADHLVAGENALFVEPRDVDGLASALVTLLQDDDLRVRMASANRERIGIFEPKLVGAEYLDVLRSFTPGRSSEPAPAARLQAGSGD
jgi:glycosyltransferase involved in cell wall biosynthesis